MFDICTLDRLEKKWGNNLTLIFLEQFYLKQLYKKILLLTLMFKNQPCLMYKKLNEKS